MNKFFHNPSPFPPLRHLLNFKRRSIAVRCHSERGTTEESNRNIINDSTANRFFTIVQNDTFILENVFHKMFLIASCVLFFFSSPMQGQEKIDWKLLGNVTFSYIQNMDQNFWYGEPTFSDEIKALEGKEVTITGYIIPLDFEANSYVLSAYTFSTCFFCGGAGQESVMELRLAKKNEKFETDEEVTLSGILRLNDRELELNYILEDARRVKKGS